MKYCDYVGEAQHWMDGSDTEQYWLWGRFFFFDME